MKIAFVHNNPRCVSGTNYINRLIEEKLSKKGVEIMPVFPDQDIYFHDFPQQLGGVLEMLVFFSTCRAKEKVIDCDAVFGTTYSALAYLGYSKNIISHFGSTMGGMIFALSDGHDKNYGYVWQELIDAGAIGRAGFDPGQDRYLNDIAAAEVYVAQKASLVIATSENIKKELIGQGIPEGSVNVVHNGIEGYWFDKKTVAGHVSDNFGVCSFGRIGNNIRDMKIKGVDRLAAVYDSLAHIPKTSIILSRNEKVCRWFDCRFKNHSLFCNLDKEDVKKKISKLRGHALLVVSRYEGFSLPLVEGMSQGMVPVAFNVGIVSEAVKDGENGFIVDTIEEMVEKVNLLAGDPVLRHRMSEAAVASSRIFAADIMADKIADLILRLDARSVV